jgi:hypothetical protein
MKTEIIEEKEIMKFVEWFDKVGLDMAVGFGVKTVALNAFLAGMDEQKELSKKTQIASPNLTAEYTPTDDGCGTPVNKYLKALLVFKEYFDKMDKSLSSYLSFSEFCISHLTERVDQ